MNLHNNNNGNNNVYIFREYNKSIPSSVLLVDDNNDNNNNNKINDGEDTICSSNSSNSSSSSSSVICSSNNNIEEIKFESSLFHDMIQQNNNNNTSMKKDDDNTILFYKDFFDRAMNMFINNHIKKIEIDLSSSSSSRVLSKSIRSIISTAFFKAMNDNKFCNNEITIIGKRLEWNLLRYCITNTTLHKLIIANNNIGDHQCYGIAQMIQQQQQINTTNNNSNNNESTNFGLSWLDLQNNNIGFDGIITLSEPLMMMTCNNNALRVLDLRWNHICVKGASIISKILINNTTLNALYLGCNEIGSAGCKLIGEGIQKQREKKQKQQQQQYNSHGCGLQILDISSNHIGDTGFISFVQNVLQVQHDNNNDNNDVTKLSILQSLDISDNMISDNGMKALSDALKVNDTLIEISLSYNKRITTKEEGGWDILTNDVFEKHSNCTLQKIHYHSSRLPNTRLQYYLQMNSKLALLSSSSSSSHNNKNSNTNMNSGSTTVEAFIRTTTTNNNNDNNHNDNDYPHLDVLNSMYYLLKCKPEIVVQVNNNNNTNNISKTNNNDSIIRRNNNNNKNNTTLMKKLFSSQKRLLIMASSSQRMIVSSQNNNNSTSSSSSSTKTNHDDNNKRKVLSNNNNNNNRTIIKKQFSMLRLPKRMAEI